MIKKFHHRPPHLTNVFQKYNNPLYFITFCTFDRKPVLANDAFYAYFVEHMQKQAQRGIVCGEYVVMPEHIHLFLRIDPYRYQLGKTIGLIKQSLSKPLRLAGVNPPHWQPGFFDHLLRSAESYAEKWSYVRENPVRAELVAVADDWKYLGFIEAVQY